MNNLSRVGESSFSVCSVPCRFAAMRGASSTSSSFWRYVQQDRWFLCLTFVSVGLSCLIIVWSTDPNYGGGGIYGAAPGGAGNPMPTPPPAGAQTQETKATYYSEYLIVELLSTCMFLSVDCFADLGRRRRPTEMPLLPPRCNKPSKEQIRMRQHRHYETTALA